MKILYLDCFGGISGDMTLGAFIDAGISLTVIEEQLKRLGLEGYTLQACQAKTLGFKGIRFLVEFVQDYHPHRTWKDISRLIVESKLPLKVKKFAISIFEKLAEAEGKVHGVPMEKVHFHEVGAIDSIIDIVGISIALHETGIEKIFCSPLPVGYGQIKSQHGPPSHPCAGYC